MNLRRTLSSLTLFLAATVLVSAAETPIPPPPARWVTDTANFLSPETVRSLDERLANYQRATGHQLIVFIAPTTGDAPIEDWAVRAFKEWKVGRKGLDDGLALFVMAQDHKLRIEVGYGLEATITDAAASRIINDVMAPRIQAGHPDDAVNSAIDALIGSIGGEASATPSAPSQAPVSKPMSPGQMILYGIIGILILGFVITHPALAFYFLASMMSGRGGWSGGGGGSGGGGFSGGGGRSGGGGASGSW